MSVYEPYSLLLAFTVYRVLWLWNMFMWYPMGMWETIGGGGLPHAPHKSRVSHRLLRRGRGGDFGVRVCTVWKFGGIVASQIRFTSPSVTPSSSIVILRHSKVTSVIAFPRFVSRGCSHELWGAVEDCTRGSRGPSIPSHVCWPAYCTPRHQTRQPPPRQRLCGALTLWCLDFLVRWLCVALTFCCVDFGCVDFVVRWLCFNFWTWARYDESFTILGTTVVWCGDEQIKIHVADSIPAPFVLRFSRWR